MSIEVEKELIFFKSNDDLKKYKNSLWKKRLKFLMWFVPSSLMIFSTLGSEVRISDIMALISYMAGIFFMIEAAFKLKQHNESLGETPLSQPIIFGIVAALLLALPTLFAPQNGTVFNENIKQNISHSNQSIEK